MNPTHPAVSVEILRHLLDRIRRIRAAFRLSSLDRQIASCESILGESPAIDVAILGQFKAGKSSFLNSLLARPLLPVGVTPVTKAITRLRHGPVEKAVVTHLDGRRSTIPLGVLEEYISETKNPSNEKQVSLVDVELPSLEDFPGLRLVDTPGLGSIFTSHRETAEQWLPEVGAALLTVSADRPLGEEDLRILRELMLHTPNVILLLTKADLLTPPQQEEVIRFFRETAERELGRSFPIYLYSIRTNTEQYKNRIEMDILNRLSVHRDREFDRIRRHKFGSLLSACLRYLAIALQMAQQDEANREALRNRIWDERVDADRIAEEMRIIVREHQRKTRPLIMDCLREHEGPLTEALRRRLAEDLTSWKGNLWQLTRRYEDWISAQMTEEMGRISSTDHHRFFDTLRKAHAHLSRSVGMFRTFLDENVQKVLGVRLADVEWQIDVPEPEWPDIVDTKPFDIHLDLIWFLIPMTLFRPLFARHFLRGVRRYVEVNLSRLAAQWESRINDAIEAVRGQALAHIQEETATLESLLSQQADRSEEIQSLMAELEAAGNVVSPAV